jgi:hypothetical protein
MSENTQVAKPTNWAEKLAKFAAAAVEQEQTTNTGGVGSWISTQAGQLTYQGNAIAGNKIDVIVADAILENHYYDVAFDRNNKRSPVCYAFGRHEDDMKPHPDAEKPQADSCKNCPKNQWPKDKKGPKECKNVRRLALLPAQPLTEEAIAKATPAWLKVPVMSVKNWAAYVRTCAAMHKRPPFGMVTTVGTVPDPKSQFLVTFTPVTTVPDELMDTVDARSEEISDLIEFSYRKNEESSEEFSAGQEAKRGRLK